MSLVKLLLLREVIRDDNSANNGEGSCFAMQFGPKSIDQGRKICFANHVLQLAGVNTVGSRLLKFLEKKKALCALWKFMLNFLKPFINSTHLFGEFVSAI